MAARKTLEERILQIIAELEALTGGSVMMFALPDSGKPVSYGFNADVELYVSRLYDTYFPSFTSEVMAIEKMGAAVLALEYGFQGIDQLLSECESYVDDPKEREKITNVLLEARAKLRQHCNQQNQTFRRKKKQ